MNSCHGVLGPLKGPHGPMFDAIISSLQPREEFIAQKQKKAEVLAAARANAPAAKPELHAFSPTKGGWHAPGKFGKLVVE